MVFMNGSMQIIREFMYINDNKIVCYGEGNKADLSVGWRCGGTVRRGLTGSTVLSEG